MATVDKPWDGSPDRWTDSASYCDSCLIDLNPSGTPRDKKVQNNCKLPVREPNGDINSNAVHAAASSLAGGRGGVKASPASKKAAAKKLVSLYSQINEDAPPSIKQIAGA